MVRGWGYRTHRPLGRKQEYRSGGVLTILSVASPFVLGMCYSRGGNIAAPVARRRLSTGGGDVSGIQPPPEACKLLSSVRQNK